MSKNVQKEIQADLWQEYRTVHIPRGARGEDKFLFVGVNGRGMQVPRGKDVEVPLPIWERLQIMLAMQEKEMEFRETIPNDFAKQAEARFV